MHKVLLDLLEVTAHKVHKDFKVLKDNKVLKVSLDYLLDKGHKVLLDMFKTYQQKQQHHILQHQDKQHLHLHISQDILMYLLMDLDLVILILLQLMGLKLY
ncbi:MAG: hypothetical protein EBX37_17425 [Alphaproteobacteria bacterium]|nr:hypothetical protein [Alphaproteobacteria bacterium]